MASTYRMSFSGGASMTGPHDHPTLDDVMDTTEAAPRDRSAHGKADPRPNDEELQHRTERERQAVGSDDADPAGADIHSATD
jgi:hypothetical protein